MNIAAAVLKHLHVRLRAHVACNHTLLVLISYTVLIIDKLILSINSNANYKDSDDFKNFTNL